MMDLATFHEFRGFAVPAKPYIANEPLILNAAEQATFDAVFSSELLLEQERVQHWYASERLRTRLSSATGK